MSHLKVCKEYLDSPTMTFQDSHKSSIHTLLFMPINNNFFLSIATTCLDGLTLDQLQDLLGSLLGNSTNVYIITNDKKVFLGTSEIGLYFNLAADTTNRAATDIWISKPPCKECTTILGIFYGVFKKPNLHIETFNFDSTIMTNMGCLAKLQDQGFGILAWDWETFLSTVGVDNSQCSDAIRNVTSDSVYSTRKLTLKEFLDIFDSLCSEETIETWCSG